MNLENFSDELIIGNVRFYKRLLTTRTYKDRRETGILYTRYLNEARRRGLITEEVR